MTWIEWYNTLQKPSWTPAPATIGMIWQILYPIILVSFGFVFVQAIRSKISKRVALPFVLNLIANLIFTPIQFGMRNLPLAAADILVVWTTIIWCIIAAWPRFRWVAHISAKNKLNSPVGCPNTVDGLELLAAFIEMTVPEQGFQEVWSAGISR